MNEKTKARFWAKVDRDGPTVRADLGPCWIWKAARYRHGPKNNLHYGKFGIDGKTHRTHRVSWEINHGAPPSGAMVLHKCDVALCVRPDHLYLGTQLDNVRDCIQRGRDRRNPIRGARHVNAKLSESDVRAIRRRYAAGGVTKTALGIEFGVSRRLIGHIICRKQWRHLID